MTAGAAPTRRDRIECRRTGATDVDAEHTLHRTPRRHHDRDRQRNALGGCDLSGAGIGTATLSVRCTSERTGCIVRAAVFGLHRRRRALIAWANRVAVTYFGGPEYEIFIPSAWHARLRVLWAKPLPATFSAPL
jgi:hypothetical protein